MKKASILFLLLFVTFLSAPTIVKLIDKTIVVSHFYNFSEEEDGMCFDVLNSIYKRVLIPVYQLSSDIPALRVLQEFQLRHDNVAEEIVLPPPENNLFYVSV